MWPHNNNTFALEELASETPFEYDMISTTTNEVVLTVIQFFVDHETIPYSLRRVNKVYSRSNV